MQPTDDFFQATLLESTRRYLRENEYVFSLPRHRYPSATKSIAVRRETIFGILRERLIQSTIVSLRYMYAVASGIGQLRRLSALKSSKKGKRALVLGNGPSLGYMDCERLMKFNELGGEIFSVNHWTATHLGTVVPDYLVISDGRTLVDPISEFGKKISEDYKNKNALLTDFLQARNHVKIMCPLSRVKELSNCFGDDRITGFVDHEMRAITSNIDPRFPRGYVSMTLFKTLALAIFMGYDEICVLGMDNTYPRDVYCDSENRVCRLERHAGGDDYILEQSVVYPSMAAMAQDLLDLFSDLRRCFSSYKILNLDPYSLTDTFNKVESIASIDEALRIGANKSGQSVGC